MYSKIVAFLSGINKWVYISMAAWFVCTTTLAYVSYQSSKIEKLKIELKTTKATLEEYSTKVVEAEKLRKEYNAVLLQNNKLKKDLNSKLNRQAKGKKSVSTLAKKKAKLVENAVNVGTQKRLDCINKVSRGESHEKC